VNPFQYFPTEGRAIFTARAICRSLILVVDFSRITSRIFFMLILFHAISSPSLSLIVEGECYTNSRGIFYVLDDLEIPADAQKMVTFHRKGGNFQAECRQFCSGLCILRKKKTNLNMIRLKKMLIPNTMSIIFILLSFQFI
jgi:hypothetical protein